MPLQNGVQNKKLCYDRAVDLPVMMVILVAVAGTILLWIPLVGTSVDSVWQTVLASVGLWILVGLYVVVRRRR